MGQKVIAVSLENDIGILESACLIRYDDVDIITDEFETPYDYEVLLNVDEKNNMVQSVEVNGADRLFNVIDKEDCLPNIGLLDYKDEDLKLDLKNVTLRELYKEVLRKVL